MSRVTKEDIKNINELYLKFGVKAKVARELGFSPATVSKYIIPDYKPTAQLKIRKFTGDLPNFDPTLFRIKSWEPLLTLSDEEFIGVKELWEELSL